MKQIVLKPTIEIGEIAELQGEGGSIQKYSNGRFYLQLPNGDQMIIGFREEFDIIESSEQEKTLSDYPGTAAYFAEKIAMYRKKPGAKSEAVKLHFFCKCDHPDQSIKIDFNRYTHELTCERCGLRYAKVPKPDGNPLKAGDKIKVYGHVEYAKDRFIFLTGYDVIEVMFVKEDSVYFMVNGYICFVHYKQCELCEDQQ